MRFASTLLLLAACATAQTRGAGVDIAYELDASKPESGVASVSMTVTGLAADEIKVAIPAWAPGAYRVTKYFEAVKNVKAADSAGIELVVSKIDDRTWSVKTNKSGSVTIRYDLDKKIDKEHAMLPGPSTYFYVMGHKEAPCRVRYKIPEGWKIATGLDQNGVWYSARDYDTFIDCSVELGKFELLTFDADGARFEIAVHANGPIDGPKLVDVCRKIVTTQHKMFGGAPFKRYVFLFHFRGGFGGGGLEHLNSTDISFSYNAVKTDPANGASLFSHEYFHLWNVKRIRPAELGPFDYTGIVRSKALWQCEGVTSYYGDLTLPRCGLWTEERYFNHLAQEIEVLQNNPDRKVTTVEVASQKTWDREDFPRIDYYNKGELLGLLMDLKIRTKTEGKKSYDDVMRYLWETYVKKPNSGPIGVGFPEDGILKAINEVMGEDWKEFYSKYISGVQELPYEILTAAGLEVELKSIKAADLGVTLRGSTIPNVPKGSEAEKAGIKNGDRIVGLNGVEIQRGNLRAELDKIKPGDTIKLKLGRGDKTEEVALKVGERDRTTCKIRRAAGATPLQKKIIDGWLWRE